MFPPDMTPSDALVSRISRECTKRKFTLYDLCHVKTLDSQVHQTAKRRKIGVNLYTDVQEEKPIHIGDTQLYLDQLHTYLLALAMAGTAPPPNAPGSP